MIVSDLPASTSCVLQFLSHWGDLLKIPRKTLPLQRHAFTLLKKSFRTIRTLIIHRANFTKSVPNTRTLTSSRC